MKPPLIAALILSFLPAFPADWSPRLAARYLDSRQQAWFAWPRANAPGGPCVSCHTGVTYLLARPQLRQALGEPDPTPYEKGLLDGLRARLATPPPADASTHSSQAIGTESVLAALLLPAADSEKAFHRLWSRQDGSGAWPWFSLDRDPWETDAAQFYGAALAAVAVGSHHQKRKGRDPATPSRTGTRGQAEGVALRFARVPETQERAAALKSYLLSARQNQPLHNRLALLWAASQWSGLLPENERQRIIREVLGRQQPDGGWTLESLGPWKDRPSAPPAQGSNAYATGFTAFALQKAGCSPADAPIARARRWLASHQDPQSGSWAASSMNQRYEPGSMQIHFMEDAATAFAALALLQ